jgi:hypothetical protein
VPGNALPGWTPWEELARGLAAGIVPRHLPGNGTGKRDATMTELPKMPEEGFS